MNLSFGTFGSIDDQISKAENMIAEFELQLDEAILHLQNKQINYKFKTVDIKLTQDQIQDQDEKIDNS